MPEVKTKKMTGTPNAGAAVERAKLLRGIRTDEKKMEAVNFAETFKNGYRAAMADVRRRIQGSAPRASKKIGGLGRK